jgi:hypothetical protein
LKGEEPTRFEIFKRVLENIPFIKETCVSNPDNKDPARMVYKVEEDPVQFRILLTFLHQGQCLPKIVETKEAGKYLDANFEVVRDFGGAQPQQYRQSLYGSISCGAHLTNTKTTEAVTGIIKQLYLSNKYEQIALVTQYLERLRLCPFGPKEVLALIENDVKNIPETGTAREIYEFMYENIHIQGPRLNSYPTFPNLFNKSTLTSRITSILAKGIARQTDFIKGNSGSLVTRCVNKLNISTCLTKLVQMILLRLDTARHK